MRVREGDLDNPASLRKAWEGCEQLLLVSSNAAASGGNALAQHATAIEVARALKVGRVFYTSQVCASSTSAFPPGCDHAATERLLEESGLPWTGLRHGFYARSALQMNMHGFHSGTIYAPEDGKVAWTTHGDLAAVDAKLLVSQDVIDGPTPPLTGSQALDIGNLAELAGQIYHRRISRILISEETAQENAKKANVPATALPIMLGYFRAARANEFATVDPTLGQLLGRAPERMGDYMAQHLPRT